MRWGTNSKEKLLLLAVSPHMSNNYSKFGDLLGINIFTDLLRKDAESNSEYKVVVLTVSDTNCRLLLAGVAVILQESPTILANTLKEFFTLHQGKLPESIMTDNSPLLTSAIGHLREEGLYGGA